MRILCPNPKCQKSLSVRDELAGRGVRCPYCGTPFRATPPPTAPGSRESGAGPAPRPGAVLPAKIGPYEVRRKLGQGAFGVVYQASDPQLGRDVAVKVLRPEALGSGRHVERFLREAKVVAQMLHGNIVPVYQLGPHDGGYFIASAFIPGRPLSEAIPENGLDPCRAVRVVVQLLEALAYAHDRGVLHRDVKPSNAMLDDKDTLYLLDFGLAGLVGQDSGRMTQDGTVMGTPAYMPPEQAQGNVQRVGPAADQYSAGVVLYELLTGHLPFEGGPMPALIYNVIHTPPPRPSEWRPDLDPRLEEVCLRALAKSPADRFGSCGEFAAALKDWLAAAIVYLQSGTAPLQESADSISNSIGMKLVLIPAGKFLMGSPNDDEGHSDDEGPQHEVEITKPFYMGKYTVTVGEFRKFVEDAGYDAGTGWRDSEYAPTDEHPVVYVGWQDAKAFCDWLAKKEGKKYRLPTEAEWEYSCRAGSGTAFSFGDDAKRLGDYAWYSGNADSKTHPVGRLKPNAFGLYDMHGNVWQLCEDWYDKDYYKDSPTRDPQGPGAGSFRVSRGGSFDHASRNCRSAARRRCGPASRYFLLGFRVVLVR